MSNFTLDHERATDECLNPNSPLYEGIDKKDVEFLISSFSSSLTSCVDILDFLAAILSSSQDGSSPLINSTSGDRVSFSFMKNSGNGTSFTWKVGGPRLCATIEDLPLSALNIGNATGVEGMVIFLEMAIEAANELTDRTQVTIWW